MQTRLHKFLANSGVASRRKAEQMMLDGLVVVNGKLATEPGTKINPEKDVIKVNGKIIRGERKVYVLLNKPRGFVTTTDDDKGRKTVMDLIEGVKERIYPVGRLDRDSEGLLVLTNDGELARYLTHPSCNVTKVYRVSVDGFITDETAGKIRTGVRVGGRKVVPEKLLILARNKRQSRLEIQIGEGLNREVRRIFAAAGHEARKLKRIFIGPLSLKGISKGRARFMTGKELKALRKAMEKEENNTGPGIKKPEKRKYKPRPRRR
ncbi:MAG: pseudouridine synthase [Planctomycetota bacterium]